MNVRWNKINYEKKKKSVKFTMGIKKVSPPPLQIFDSIWYLLWSAEQCRVYLFRFDLWLERSRPRASQYRPLRGYELWRLVKSIDQAKKADVRDRHSLPTSYPLPCQPRQSAAFVLAHSRFVQRLCRTRQVCAAFVSVWLDSTAAAARRSGVNTAGRAGPGWV